MISYACVVNSNEHFFSNQKVPRTLVFSFFIDGEITCSLFFLKIVILFLHSLAVCVQVCTYVPDPANVQKSETTWRSWFSSTTMWVLEMVISLPSWQSARVSCQSTGFNPQCFINWLCLQIPITSALRRWRLSIHGHPQNSRSSLAYTEFEASLEYWDTLGEWGW